MYVTDKPDTTTTLSSLVIEGMPESTKSLTLILDDPDQREEVLTPLANVEYTSRPKKGQ
jgi:hypothetical protein